VQFPPSNSPGPQPRSTRRAQASNDLQGQLSDGTTSSPPRHRRVTQHPGGPGPESMRVTDKPADHAERQPGGGGPGQDTLTTPTGDVTNTRTRSTPTTRGRARRAGHRVRPGFLTGSHVRVLARRGPRRVLSRRRLRRHPARSRHQRRARGASPTAMNGKRRGGRACPFEGVPRQETAARELHSAYASVPAWAAAPSSRWRKNLNPGRGQPTRGNFTISPLVLPTAPAAPTRMSRRRPGANQCHLDDAVHHLQHAVPRGQLLRPPATAPRRPTAPSRAPTTGAVQTRACRLDATSLGAFSSSGAGRTPAAPPCASFTEVRGSVLRARAFYLLIKGRTARRMRCRTFRQGLTTWTASAPMPPPLPWLPRITTNHCLNALRAAGLLAVAVERRSRPSPRDRRRS